MDNFDLLLVLDYESCEHSSFGDHGDKLSDSFLAPPTLRDFELDQVHLSQCCTALQTQYFEGLLGILCGHDVLFKNDYNDH